MALQVAQCPRCKMALVFGEKACVHCGQTFQYGASSPPQPTPAEIRAALAVAGAPPRPESSQPMPAASRPSATATVEGLDTGRFNDVGNVQTEEIPGFIDSTLFKAFTPARVEAQPVSGFDGGRFADVGNVATAAPMGLEPTARDDVDVGFVNSVSGIFGSDIYDTRNVEVAPPPVEGIEASPSVQRATKLKRVPDDELTKIVCRCGETHRLPRCPSCGTVHPAQQG